MIGKEVYRGQVAVVQREGVQYLYTHWHGRDLIRDVHIVLSKRLRWAEPDYLSRMLFCQMLPREAQYDDNGLGISLIEYADTLVKVEIDTVSQMIRIFRPGLSQPDWAGTFVRFIQEYPFPPEEQNPVLLA